ncbi:hypothetical protein E1267_22405 [Nonomuraea longispora]|uniref:Uncharacterized protein n=1 Tax=Nonomuraea longispora TaxID=1848320 RepID=A0A4R4N6V4_9ACTN|nr:hypothetical protein [Nonomuraea longispora]TDC04578.1 hypothetical protein E1267_22405 [Nonomuraea longispora]
MNGFPELEKSMRREVGARLFTVLAWIPGRRTLRRVHSSHPEQYPVGGEKSVEVAQGWLAQCVEGGQPYHAARSLAPSAVPALRAALQGGGA